MRATLISALVLGSLGLAACSSSGGRATSVTSGGASNGGSTTLAAGASSSSSTSGGSSVSGTAGSGGVSTTGGGRGTVTTTGSGGGSSSSGSSSGGGPAVDAGYLGVLQRANDLARDAVYVDPAFTKATLDAGTPTVDSTFQSPTYPQTVYAAPLYFVNDHTGLDLVIVADEGNDIYALSAANGTPAWKHVPLLPPSMAGGGNIGPPLGITGTPVIDPDTRTLFFDAATDDDAGARDHLIYALDLDDGSTRAGWPVDFNTLGTTLANGSTYQCFSPDNNQRGALTFLNGTVYVPYGGNYGDYGGYHGTVVAIQEANPSQITLFATTVHQAGIWGPSGVASDGTSLFVSTGNGDHGGGTGLHQNEAGGTWYGGEGILRLGPGATFSDLATDYFAPTDYLSLDIGDSDLGSEGPVLFDFNDPLTGLQHLIFDMGKTHVAYLVNQQNLGGIEGEVSSLTASTGQPHGSLAAYTTPIASYLLFNGSYNGPGSCPGGGNGDLIALQVTPSTASSPIGMSVAWCASGNDIQAPLVSTSDGTHDAIVWSISGEQLRAFDGDTGQGLASLSVGSMQYWNTPIVAKGRMFLTTSNNQTVAVLP
jgi:hypothetical protein